MSTDQYEYDVCLSFAGEQRSYVEEVAARLSDSSISTFYDKYEQATLWGKDLYDHLDSVYRLKARYCVLFVSADYARKVWTSHERKSAQARALIEKGEYILPVRFDDTELPGLRSTVGYLETKDTTPDQLVSLIRDKLKTVTKEAFEPTYRPKGVPLTPSEQQRLLGDKPLGWEYLLFGGVLIQGKAKLAPKDRDHQLRYAQTVRRIADDEGVLELITDTIARADKMIGDGLMTVIDERAQDWAFGPPGIPGNEENIIHLGQRFLGIYESMYDLAAELRGTAVPSKFKRAIELLARFMDGPIKQTGQFVEDYAKSLIDVSDRLDAGESVQLQHHLVLSIDDEVLNEYSRELDKITQGHYTE